MAKLIFTILFGLSLFTNVFADAVLKEFMGTPQGDRIVINWKTGEEKDINIFLIERSNDNKIFTKIGEIAAKGDNSDYQFEDTNLTTVQATYYYRLRIRRTDGTFQMTEVITVIPKISSFAKTWGSIKALFQ